MPYLDNIALLTSPLTLFQPSPTNPRRRFDPASIASLAETIAPHGVQQPILARERVGAPEGAPPLEIVFGERRWRACTLLTEQGRNPHGDGIPYFLKALSDAEVLELQLLENISRVDLHPLEEAEHYERMRQQPAQPSSVEDIARIAKVPVDRVYQRLSLLALVPAAREAFMAEQLTLKTALQVARMPPAVQAELTTHLANWGGEPMGPKAAAQFIRDRYMLRLTQAPFDVADAALVPDAGACGTCPKRTGASPQLFGDISDADTCTDAACFASKKAAQRERLVDELRTSGYTVLQGDAARDACTADGRHLKPGLHLLEEAVPANLGDSSLKVVDVLTRAQAPNEHTSVVDHPAGPVLVYAVRTAHLEDALRKIKAHRAQLDKAAQKKAQAQAKAAAPAPAPAPEPTPAPAPGADAAAAPAGSPAEAHANSDWPWPGNAEDQPAKPAFRGPSDELLEKLLHFHVPATSNGKYGYQTAAQFSADRQSFVLAVMTAFAIASRMATDQAEGLPTQRLAAMIITALLHGDAYLDMSEAAALCGLQSPASQRLDDEIDWAWQLPEEDAARLAMVMLALQETTGSDGFERFAPAAAAALELDFEHLPELARKHVAGRMQLAAMDNGKPAEKAAKPKKPGAKKAGQGAA